MGVGPLYSWPKIGAKEELVFKNLAGERVGETQENKKIVP
jgi:hypothetical protein